MSDPREGDDDEGDGSLDFLDRLWADMAEDLDRDQLVPPMTHERPD